MLTRFQSRLALGRRAAWILTGAALLWLAAPDVLPAQDESPAPARPQIEFRNLFEDGGAIGIIILALSVAMIALIVEHLLSIRRGALMPTGLADDVHQLVRAGEYRQAEQMCRDRPSFLGRVLSSGLAEVDLGYTAVEKSMEDASAQQAARLFRKIEYLSMISTIAPMLGLLGTVWGMILAFLEFTVSANPQPAQLAPGISKALITTLMGLGVAVPAVASFHIFRNRIDELVADVGQHAEGVLAELKRSQVARRRAERERRSAGAASNPKPAAPPSQPQQPQAGIPPVTIERHKPV